MRLCSVPLAFLLRVAGAAQEAEHSQGHRRPEWWQGVSGRDWLCVPMRPDLGALWSSLQNSAGRASMLWTTLGMQWPAEGSGVAGSGESQDHS